MKKKTKIVATISDLKCEVEFIRELYQEGMNVVRLNTVHQTPEQSLKIIENVRKVSEKIGILIDTKGPEIRTIVKETMEVNKGDTVVISATGNSSEDEKFIQVSYPGFINEIKNDAKILIDDGALELQVINKSNDTLICRVENPGVLKNKKSINVPCSNFALPSISEKDKQYIEFGAKNNVDFIAHSFVRSKKDVIEVQKLLDKHNSSIKIISKIENREGVDKIDEIIEHSYGIMVARGDLGIEIPYEKIPGIQKKIVNKCIEARKPVIIATQMLHTMINEPRPTRAEVSDVANAIYSKTDAIMLSGETAYGKYPVESVKTMARIAHQVEKTRGDIHETGIKVLSTDISAYLVRSAVEASLKLKAKAIIADTTSGRTIRNMAGYRGRKLIYAICYDEKTCRLLSLSFGVYPQAIVREKNQSGFQSFVMNFMMEKKLLKPHHRVVVLGGNFGTVHGASHLEISTMENLAKVK